MKYAYLYPGPFIIKPFTCLREQKICGSRIARTPGPSASDSYSCVIMHHGGNLDTNIAFFFFFLESSFIYRTCTLDTEAVTLRYYSLRIF